MYGSTGDTAACGVYGATSASGAKTFGVAGESSHASGVLGSTSGNGYDGVLGRDISSGGGYGVQGTSAALAGVGVLAANTASGGTALKVAGAAEFSRSGSATIAGATSMPKDSVTISGVSYQVAWFVVG